jgi:hypothetical protein
MKKILWLTSFMWAFIKVGIASDPLLLEENEGAANPRRPTSVQHAEALERENAYIEEVASSYGLSSEALQEEALKFLDKRSASAHDHKQYMGQDQPSSINDLIAVKKSDPDDFIKKFNEFNRMNGKSIEAKASDFNFAYPMFLIPLDAK